MLPLCFPSMREPRCRLSRTSQNATSTAWFSWLPIPALEITVPGVHFNLSLRHGSSSASSFSGWWKVLTRG